MAKAQAPQVHMDMPIEEALDFVECVEDLQKQIESQPHPVHNERIIATRLKVIKTLSDAMKLAMRKAI